MYLMQTMNENGGNTKIKIISKQIRF